MKLFFLLLLAFIFQEPVSTNAVLLTAYQSHFNIWTIHLIFALATGFDAIAGYYIGVIVHKSFSKTKFFAYLKPKADSFVKFAGKNGQRAAIFIYGPLLFPISAVIAPWLEISFWDAFIFLILGDIVFWYIPEWVVVLGVKSFISDPHIALYAVVAVTFIITIAMRYFKKRKK